MGYAPIALFTYNRADHTQLAVESLLKNTEAKESELFIFSDGPKNEKAVEGVGKNRDYIHEVKKLEGSGFKTVTIVEREKNWGLANSLIAGITELTDKYGRVIVVEDDLILSPYFLKFMNDGLEKYKNDERVASISGYLSPIEGNVPETFFLRYFACWGWATWKRGWDILINDSRELLKQLRWKKNDFNIGGTGPYYGILYCDKVGLNDSWAIRYYASQFLANKLQLFPGRTLVTQTGFDGTGTHSKAESDDTNHELSLTPIVLKDIPVIENKEIYKAFSNFNKQKVKAKYVWCQIDKFKSFVRRLLNLDCK